MRRISASFNNTIVTLTDTQGNALSWASLPADSVSAAARVHAVRRADRCGDCREGCMEYGLKTVEVYVKGPGSGREAAIRSLQAAGLEVNMIRT